MQRRCCVPVASLFIVLQSLSELAFAVGGNDTTDELLAHAPMMLTVEGGAATDDDTAFRWGLTTSWMYGPVDGQIQTPSGGRHGTSSVGRPTFQELGIDNIGIIAAEGTFGWAEHDFFMVGQWIRLLGDAILEETLVSQAITFPAGSRVTSEVQMDIYRAGYRHRLDLLHGPDGRPCLILSPSGGVAFVAFNAELHGSGDAEMNRSYIKGAPEIGLSLEWLATDRLTISGELSSTVTFSKLPLIMTAKLQASYTLVRCRGMTAALTTGVAYEAIRYDDGHKQEFPNDIKSDFGPMLVIGIDVRF